MLRPVSYRLRYNVHMLRLRPLLAVLAVAALVLTNCSQPKDDEPEPVYAEVPTSEQVRAVDLLFVVDNSNSMTEEQELLVAEAEILFRELIDPSSSDGAAPVAVEDLHVGIVTTDLGAIACDTMGTCCASDEGMLQNVGRTEGCSPTYSAPDCSADRCPWLTHSEEHPDVGDETDSPPIWDDFACIATLGTGGCAEQQPLESTHLALSVQTGPGQPNEGFVRSDSVLATVYLTDEDDCSAQDLQLFNPTREDLGPMNTRCVLHPDMLYPVAEYADMLRDLRPFDDDVLVVAAITGVPIDGSWSPGDPIEELRDLQRVNPENPNELMHSCMTDMGLAFPPVRLAEFVDSFGDAGILGSICRDDWSDTMMSIARAIQSRMTYECYEIPEDVDPATECRLIEILSDGTEREIPHEAEGVEGWSIGSTARGCPSGQLQFSDGVEIDGEVRLECVVVEEE